MAVPKKYQNLTPEELAVKTEAKCVEYDTTVTSCKCTGFKFYHHCYHNDYKKKRQAELDAGAVLKEGECPPSIPYSEFNKQQTPATLIQIVNGTDIDDAVKQHGEQPIQDMIHTGQLFFDRKSGRLYNSG